MKQFRRWRLWAVVPCLALVSSCVGVTHHHVMLDDCPVGKASLTDALKCANNTRDEYKQALLNQDIFQTTLGTILIPLGAATLGLGILDGGRKPITILGLTGAAAYGVGTWLQRRPDQLAYIAGSSAINCAIEAVIPLHVEVQAGPPARHTGENGRAADPATPGAQTQDGAPVAGSLFEEFKTKLRTIDDQIAKVEQQIAIVKLDIAGRQASNATQVAQQQIDTAERVVANAIAARSSGVSLETEIEAAGGSLVAAVRNIDDAVDLAIATSQPNLTTVSSVLDGLGAAYGKFTTVPEGLRVAPPAQPGAAPQSEGPSVPSVQDLAIRTAALAASSRAIGDFVNAVAATKPTERLRACGVDPSKLASDISIEPPGPIEFTAGQAATKTVVVQGGQRPYTGELHGTPSGLSRYQPEPLGPVFNLVATADSRAGEYSLVLRDGSTPPRVRVVEVVVVGAAPPQADRTVAADGSAADASERLFNTYSEEDRKRIQRGVCVENVDGKWGPVTLNALREYKRKTTGRPDEGDALTREMADEILAPSESDIDVRCRLLDLHGELSGATFNIIHNNQVDGEVAVRSRNVDGRAIRINVAVEVTKRPTIQAISTTEIANAILIANADFVENANLIAVTISNPEALQP